MTTITTERLIRFAAAAGIENPSIVVQNLQTGLRAAVEPERPLYPASMLKTPLALTALHMVQAGELRLEQRWTVGPGHLTTNDAESPLALGYETTLQDLIERALIRSDNIATNVLFDVVGRGRATAIARDYGLATTAFHRKLSGSEPLIVDPDWDGVHRNTHPAADAALLFERIARGTVPFAEFLRNVLGRQYWKNKLAAGLAPGDRFAHKTGDTDEVTHDGGILTAAAGSYVVVVYSGMPSSDDNNAAFGRFMSALRPELDGFA